MPSATATQTLVSTTAIASATETNVEAHTLNSNISTLSDIVPDVDNSLRTIHNGAPIAETLAVAMKQEMSRNLTITKSLSSITLLTAAGRAWVGTALRVSFHVLPIRH